MVQTSDQQSVDRWFWALVKLVIAMLVYLAVIWPTYWLAKTHAIDPTTGVGFMLFFTATALMVSLFFTFKPKKANQTK
jgi:hypothetical protein